MGNYTILGVFGNPRRGGQARNLTKNVPKILNLKLSSEQVFSKSCRWVPLNHACTYTISDHETKVSFAHAPSCQT